MAKIGPSVTEATLGAWLIKASPENLPLDELARSGFEGTTSRCVRPTYRADLIRAGQPVLWWVSGRNAQYPAGIHATGHTTGPVQRGDELAMPVRVRAVDPVVGREEILAVPGLADLEVLRMPAGSNPSYVDTVQYRMLRQAFPQLAGG